jgi:hypothetical protein
MDDADTTPTAPTGGQRSSGGGAPFGEGHQSASAQDVALSSNTDRSLPIHE